MPLTEFLSGEMTSVLAAALLAGMMVALPLGPMGQLAARLTVEKHRRAAREVALISTASDAVLAAVVLVFLSFLPDFHVRWNPWLLAFVGLALVLLGMEIWRSAPLEKPGKLPLGFKTPWKCAVFYTLLHPGALFVFAAAFGALKAQGVLTGGAGVMLMCWIGVMLGVMGTWICWLALVHRLKRSYEPGLMRMVFARGLALAFAVAGTVLLVESRVPQDIWPNLPPWLQSMLM